MELEVINWEKYNPRSDVKQSSWFRFEHSFFENPQIYSFTNEEKLVWIYILCLASKRNGLAFLNFDHADRVANLKKKVVENTIEKLKELQIVRAHVTRTLRARYADVTDTYATNERTNERTNEQNQVLLDFDALYQKYPRKLGKQTGLSKLKKTIKSQEVFLLVEKALDNYLDHIKSENIEIKYIKHFSTWVSCWRDYLDVEAKKSEYKPKFDG